MHKHCSLKSRDEGKRRQNINYIVFVTYRLKSIDLKNISARCGLCECSLEDLYVLNQFIQIMAVGKKIENKNNVEIKKMYASKTATCIFLVLSLPTLIFQHLFSWHFRQMKMNEVQ